MISEVGGENRRGSAEGNERVARRAVREEIRSALKKMKGGKAVGLDSIVVQIFKSGGISIINWLESKFNRCIRADAVPTED